MSVLLRFEDHSSTKVRQAIHNAGRCSHAISRKLITISTWFT